MPRLAIPEEKLGLESIMRAAPELDIADCSLSACAVRHHVMELKERPFCAAATIVGYEGALAAVAHLHGSPDFGWDVT